MNMLINFVSYFVSASAQLLFAGIASIFWVDGCLLLDEIVIATLASIAGVLMLFYHGVPNAKKTIGFARIYWVLFFVLIPSISVAVFAIRLLFMYLSGCHFL